MHFEFKCLEFLTGYVDHLSFGERNSDLKIHEIFFKRAGAGAAAERAAGKMERAGARSQPALAMQQTHAQRFQVE